MGHREKADYTDGRDSDISGKEADDLYAPIGPLKAIGAEPVFFDRLFASITGEHAPYPSR